MTLVDGRCVRSDLDPAYCWHCRKLPDDPFDGAGGTEEEPEHVAE